MAGKERITEKQLSGMAINPMAKGRMVENYPHLIPLIQKSELPGEIDSDNFLRFIAYVYDPQSPLVVQFPSLDARKRRAGELTDFKPAQEHAQTVVQYLQQIVKERDWTVIVSMERMFDEFTELLNEPIKTSEVDDETILKSAEKKIKIKNEMRVLAAEISVARKAYFCDDEDLEKAAAPLRTVEDRVSQRGKP